MPPKLARLREKLKESPADWDLRLELADELVSQGNSQQAGVLVSTAPDEPESAVHLTRAASYLLALDPALSIRYTKRALSIDESNAEAALIRAEAHRARGEAPDAHRFYVVGLALDPSATANHADLQNWLSSQGLISPAPEPAPNSPEPGKDRHFINSTRLIPSSRGPEVTVSPLPEDDVSQIVQVSPLEPDDAEEAEAIATPLVKIVSLRPPIEEPEETKVVLEEDDEDLPVLSPAPETLLPQTGGIAAPPPTPAQRKLVVNRASAAVIAILIHVALVLLLGILVIIVPQPPVAELVGIVSPELTQEEPEIKKVVPASMSTPSVVSASTSRAISATGVSAVALPEFDAKGALDALPEIVSTDLGASFALPFSPKGTSAVNFFGIKSKGRRVAFLIDAERYMLTDPRGGYPAYQIVKEEIAGMIGKLGLETMFNVVLYEGRNVSAFSERLLPATAANKSKVSEWLYPVNREFEKLGLVSIKYPIHPLEAEVEPVKNDFITGYLRAIQYALECDVDAVFVITSGYRSMEIPRTKEDREKILKDMKWTEKDDIAWREAIKKGQDWLNKENASRKAKGVPERVIVNIGEVWRDMGLRPPRSPPGGIQITAEEREDQVKNAVRLHYLATGKPKPQINFVIFIGKDQDKDTVPQLEHFENIAHRARGGKVRVLEGMSALKNVTGRN